MDTNNQNHYYLVFRHIAGSPPKHTICFDIKEFGSEVKMHAAKEAATNLLIPPESLMEHVTTDAPSVFIASCAALAAEYKHLMVSINYLGME